MDAPLTIMGKPVISRIGHCTQGASANSFSVSSFAKIATQIFSWLGLPHNGILNKLTSLIRSLTPAATQITQWLVLSNTDV